MWCMDDRVNPVDGDLFVVGVDDVESYEDEGCGGHLLL